MARVQAPQPSTLRKTRKLPHTAPRILLRYWDFFFALAALAGLYALHRLKLVREGSGARIHARDLALEAARALRGLGLAGSRDGFSSPLGRLVGRRPQRIRPAAAVHAPSTK